MTDELTRISNDAFVLATRSLLERRFLDLQPLAFEATPPLRGDDKVIWFEATSFAALEEDRLTELAIDLCDALHSAQLPWLVWIAGRSGHLEFRYGTPSTDEAGEQAVLKRTLDAFLVGASLEGIHLTDRKVSSVIGESAYAIVGLPSERVDTRIETRLDEALDGLAGQDFDIVVRMEPLPRDVLDRHRGALARLGSEVHAKASEKVFREQGKGKSLEKSKAQSHYKNEEDLEEDSLVTESGHSHQERVDDDGLLKWLVIGASVAASVATANPAIGMIGGSLAQALDANAPVKTDFDSEKAQVRSGHVSAHGRRQEKSRRVQEELHERETRSAELVDKNAGLLAAFTDERLERLALASGHGLWRTSVVVAAPTDLDARVAAHLLVGALRGDRTSLEPLRSLKLPSLTPDQQIRIVGARGLPATAPDETMERLRELVGRDQAETGVDSLHELIGPSDAVTWLSGVEAAHWVRPPARPIAGLAMRPFVELSSFVPPLRHQPGTVQRLAIGHILHHGRVLVGTHVEISSNELMRHVLVTGTTGAGKTTTVQTILSQLQRLDDPSGRPIPFMVVEPAKTEYHTLFERLCAAKPNRHPLRLVPREPKTNLAETGLERQLRFNPFAAEAGVPFGRHFEAIKILLRSCFALQESLPQVIEQVLWEAYTQFGWQPSDFARPVPQDLGNRKWPTFQAIVDSANKVLGIIPKAVNSLGYEDRISANFRAAVKVRLQSFTLGYKGLVFGGADDIDWADVLSRPTFIELSEIPEPDVRRFLIGALMIRLSEYRALHGKQDNLCHLLVLEEAHHVLRHDPGSSPSASLIRESNLLLADGLAELRAYGQGILVADQSPAELEPAILRNTGTKLLHTSYYEPDVRAVADSIGLEESQRNVLRRLGPGECVVKTPSLQLPVVCRVEKRV